MNTNHSLTSTVGLGFAILAVAALLPLRAGDAVLPIQITCSPSAVILNAVATGDCLTVHTDLPLRDVDTESPIELNGVQAYLVKSDNRGCLVAKFDLTVMRSLLTPPMATLCLTGYTKDGSEFVGTDDIRVVR